MPPKELWEAYSYCTVRPSVRASVLLIWIWELFSSLEIDKGQLLNKVPWPSVSFCKLHKMIQGTSGEVIK